MTASHVPNSFNTATLPPFASFHLYTLVFSSIKTRSCKYLAYYYSIYIKGSIIYSTMINRAVCIEGAEPSSYPVCAGDRSGLGHLTESQQIRALMLSLLRQQASGLGKEGTRHRHTERRHRYTIHVSLRG